MQYEFLDNKRQILRLKVERPEDLWLLYTIIKPGDIARMRTFREIKQGEKGRSSSRRIPMTLSIRVKNLEFQPFTNRLRIRGIVVEGPEEFGLKGHHHTFNIDVGSTLTLLREKAWPRHVIRRLEKSRQWGGKVMIVAVDYDELGASLLTSQGLLNLVEKNLGIHGKEGDRETLTAKALAEAAAQIERFVEKHEPLAIIVGGPGFLKETLARRLREAPGISSRGTRVIVENASMGGYTGVGEIIRRGTPMEVLRQEELRRAEKLLEELLTTLGRDPSMAAVGLESTHNAAEMRALREVIVNDEMISTYDEHVREKVEEILEKADEQRAGITIVPSNTPAGERLSGLGGIAALLRFPIEPEEVP